MSHDPEDWCKMWRKTDLLFQKWQEFGEILTLALKSLKNLHFHFLQLCKVFNVWPKKVQGRYFSWHWRVMQSLKKNWLVVWKMTWDISQIFTRALESLKIATVMQSFNPKYELNIYRGKSMSLTITEELCVMTNKNNAKFEEELTCHFKIDMKNLTNFDLSTWKSQKFSF